MGLREDPIIPLPHETQGNLTPTVVYQTKPASPHNAPKDATSDAA